MANQENILFPFSVNSDYQVRNIDSYTDFGFCVNGHEVIDLSLGGAGCFMLGFSQREIVEYVAEKMISNPFVCGEFYTINDPVRELSNILYQRTGYRSFFSTSGSDAIETAIKVSGIYHNNKIKRNIIGIKGAYHGSTFLTSGIGDLDYMVAANGKSSRCIAIDFTTEDEFLAKFEQQPSELTAAIVIESCSWAIGLITYSKSFWQRLRSICNQKDILLIIDDIAMCGGKTGHYFGFDLSIEPDMFCVGKAFSGGYFPFTACMISSKVNDRIKDSFFAHGHTHSLSMSGVYSTLKQIELVDHHIKNYNNVKEQGDALFNKLGLSYRSYGLVYCIELGVNSSTMEETFFKNGLNVGLWSGSNNTVFVLIPLLADAQYFDKLETGFVNTLEELSL